MQRIGTPRLRPDDLRRLSRIIPGRTTVRAAVEVATIVALAAAIEASGVFVLYPLAWLLIASRQHALLVLMHDCAHHRATRTRWLNDVLGELISWPFLMTMRGYRRHHQLHHVEHNLNTERDPDFARTTREGWHFPRSRRWLFTALVRDVLLLNTPELLREARDARNNVIETRADVAWLSARLIFLLAGATALTVTGAWKLYALYWLLPSLTALKAILRLRAIADHFGLFGSVAPTRTVLAPWWERLLLGPCSIGLHHVHHAHASIPYYRLREAHALLSEQAEYRASVRVASSYQQAVLHECCPAEVGT